MRLHTYRKILKVWSSKRSRPTLFLRAFRGTSGGAVEEPLFDPSAKLQTFSSALPSFAPGHERRGTVSRDKTSYFNPCCKLTKFCGTTRIIPHLGLSISAINKNETATINGITVKRTQCLFVGCT
jgi:hypothetical protein